MSEQAVPATGSTWTGVDDVRAQLTADGLDVAACELIVQEALDEDLGGRGVVPDLTGERVDVTSVATVPAEDTAVGDLVARQPGTVAGLAVAGLVFAVCAGDHPVRITAHVADGTRVETGTVLMTVEGNTRALLTAERTALNLVSLVSGVATATRAWVDALDGTGARVRDSRKTTPGLRMLQKYAVRAAGGLNHRMALSDAALIKDNHVIAAGGVVPAYRAVRERFPDLPVQVEATTAEQVDALVAAGAREILLDNMSVEQMTAIVSAHREQVVFEASGGLGLANAIEVASSGVQLIAVGAITHSAKIMDIALDLRSLTA